MVKLAEEVWEVPYTMITSGKSPTFDSDSLFGLSGAQNNLAAAGIIMRRKTQL